MAKYEEREIFGEIRGFIVDVYTGARQKALEIQPGEKPAALQGQSYQDAFLTSFPEIPTGMQRIARRDQARRDKPDSPRHEVQLESVAG